MLGVLYLGTFGGIGAVILGLGGGFEGGGFFWGIRRLGLSFWGFMIIFGTWICSNYEAR